MASMCFPESVLGAAHELITLELLKHKHSLFYLKPNYRTNK